jgi:hypothetical protein
MTQTLMLHQYLESQLGRSVPKEKLAFAVDGMADWLESMRKRVMRLLEQSGSDGGRYVKSLRHLLAHEQYWVSRKDVDFFECALCFISGTQRFLFLLQKDFYHSNKLCLKKIL